MNYNVFWNGVERKIDTTNINEPCYNEPKKQEFVIISSDKGGKMRITSKATVKSAIVRPLSLKIVPEIIDEHTIEIDFAEPKKVSVEINGSYENNLLVFLSPENIAAEADFENVIRFKEGVHEIGEYQVEKDNTLIIIEEGAFLMGGIIIKNRENVTVCGKGIISKLHYHEKELSQIDSLFLISLKNSKNVNIYDVTVANSVRWTVAIFNSIDVYINNINILGSTGNNDGIDVCNSKNVLVENVFTRTWDDSFCVKATGQGTASFSLGKDGDSSCKSGSVTDGNVENVVFRNSTLWNDFARPMEVGVEIRSDYCRNIVFKNIDVIHSMTGYPIMGIHHGDHAEVSDILIDDIRLEDIHGGQIFDLRIADAVWNQDGEKGNIHDVTIRNIAVVEEQATIPSHSRIEGFSEKANIENVVLENFSFCGREAMSIEECQVDVYDFVNNIKYIPHESKDTLNKMKTDISYVEEPKLGKDGLYRSKVRVTLSNIGNKMEKGNFNLHISPLNTAYYDSSEKEFALEANTKKEYDFDVAMQAGKYVIDIQSANPSVQYAFRFVEYDAHISDSIENASEFRFVNYYGEEVKGFRFAVKDNELLVYSPVQDKLTVSVALPAERRTGDVVFTCEETDFGIAPAVVSSKDGFVAAPQLRCPAEIWYVFKNQPAVKEIVNYDIEKPEGVVHIPFETLHLPDGCKNFWVEFTLHSKEYDKRRYSFSLFHTVQAGRSNTISHMFANVIVD